MGVLELPAVAGSAPRSALRVPRPGGLSRRMREVLIKRARDIHLIKSGPLLCKQCIEALCGCSVQLQCFVSVPAGLLPTAGSFCTCEGGWGVITTVMSALMSALHGCTVETHHVGIPGIPGTPRLSIRLYETVDTLYSTLHADYARRAHRTVATH